MVKISTTTCSFASCDGPTLEIGAPLPNPSSATTTAVVDHQYDSCLFAGVLDALFLLLVVS